MSSESTSRSTGTRLVRAVGLVTLAALALGCGHKKPPVPPPLRHPAATKDLAVEQRGEEFILSFGFPQTTVSGTPLEPLELVEVWEIVKPIPEWTPPTTADDEAGDEVAEGAGDEATGETVADGEEAETIFETVAGGGDDPSRPDPEPDAGDEETEASGPGNETLVESTEEEPKSDEADDAEADERSSGDEPEDDSEPVIRVPTKEELVAVSKQEFVAVAALRVSFDAAAIEAASVGDRIVVTLPIEVPESAGLSDLPEGTEFGSSFAVKTGVTSKLVSNFSNVMTIAHRDAPEPPSDFTIEPDQNKVAIRWLGDVPSEELVGFHVHRREAQNPRYGQALALVPIDKEEDEGEEAEPSDEFAEPVIEEEDPEANAYEYYDRSAVLGQRYIYALTTVSNRSPLVESAITAERELDYTDRFAPGSPRNPIALAETGRIRLLWDAAPEPDLEGYLVERAADETDFSRIVTEPLTEPEYSDREVVSGSTYRYRVVAVDTAGNEGAPSKVVEVRAP